MANNGVLRLINLYIVFKIDDKAIFRFERIFRFIKRFPQNIRNLYHCRVLLFAHKNFDCRANLYLGSRFGRGIAHHALAGAFIEHINNLRLQVFLFKQLLCGFFPFFVDIRDRHERVGAVDRQRDDGTLPDGFFARGRVLFQNRADCLVRVKGVLNVPGKFILRVILDVVDVHPNKIRDFHRVFRVPVTRLEKRQDSADDCHERKRNDNTDYHVGCGRFLFFSFLLVVVLVAVAAVSRFPDILDGIRNFCGAVAAHVVIFKTDTRVLAEQLNILEHGHRGLVPHCGVLLHGLDCNFLQAVRNRGIDLLWRLWVGLELHNRNRNGIVRLEGQYARKHFVKHNADGINIRFAVRHISARLLRRDIMD